MPIPRCCTFVTLGALGASLAALPAWAEPSTVAAFEVSSWRDLMPDERDAGLVRAIELIGPRVREVTSRPDVAPFMSMLPEGLIELVVQVSGRPVRFALVNATREGGRSDIDGFLSLTMSDKRDAELMHARLAPIVGPWSSARPEKSAEHPGMVELELPIGELLIGPVEEDTGWTYQFRLGGIEDVEAPFGDLPEASDGVQPVVRGMVDTAAVSSLVEPFVGLLLMAQPGGAAQLEQLEAQGLWGEDAMTFEVTSWFADGQSITELRSVGAKAFAEGLFMPEDAIDRDLLAMIPGDATWAGVRPFPVESIYDQIKRDLQSQGLGDGVQKGLAQFEEMTGVSFEDDLLASLGERMIVYLADSTGGGSITSAVVAMELDDPNGMEDALDRLGASIENASREVLAGAPFSVRFTMMEAGDRSMRLIRLGGLPIPIEPTFAVQDGWLITGATPGATAAALEHIARPNGRSLLDNASFARAYREHDGSAVDVQYVNAERTMRDGYALLSLGCSALANTVRSPSDPTVDPGMVLPTPLALAEGVQPILTTATWAGDDLVVMIETDSSSLARTAAVLGIGDAGSVFGGVALGAALGAGAVYALNEFESAMGGLGAFEPGQDRNQTPGDEDGDRRRGRDVDY
ncbi:MAG: hypothetical protein AAGI30_09845 [Planctomycetota bacterium]